MDAVPASPDMAHGVSLPIPEPPSGTQGTTVSRASSGIPNVHSGPPDNVQTRQNNTRIATIAAGTQSGSQSSTTSSQSAGTRTLPRKPLHKATPGSAVLELNRTTLFDPPRRRTRVWWVLAGYLPLITIPWVLRCIMNYRPLTASRYFDPTGSVSNVDFEVNEAWQAAVSVMNSIAAVVTIPAVSLVLAETSVIWLQHGACGPQTLSLAQFFDIADRGWTDIPTVWHEIRRPRMYNSFIVKAAAFTLLCGIILPLQEVLVRTETMQVITSKDVPCHDTNCSAGNFQIAGSDAQLAMMNVLPLWNVKEEIKEHLATDTEHTEQTDLWSIGGVKNTDFDSYADDTRDPGEFLSMFTPGHAERSWVSALPNGTTTGVLPQHAMRLNSSISCSNIRFEDIPAICPGSQPFATRFAFNENMREAQEDQPFDYNIRVCVPGCYTSSPWSRSRDAETIFEELFLGLNQQGSGFATHCTVNTTRGYFELPNALNDFIAQPLLHQYPRGKAAEQYVDYDRRFTHLWEQDQQDLSNVNADWTNMDAPLDYWTAWYPGSPAYFLAPGPLTISAVAVFSNESYFGESRRAATLNTTVAAKGLLCHGYRVPFAANGDLSMFQQIFQGDCGGLESEGGSQVEVTGSTVTTFLLQWFGAFSNPSDAEKALGLATYYANDALLTQAKNRPILSSDGRTSQKPKVSLASIIVVSLLLATQELILLRLAYVAWRTPAWTNTFESRAVAQLANAMNKDTLPPAGCNEKQLQVLHQLDGRIGVAVRSGDGGKSSYRQLMHGGSEPLVIPKLAGIRRRRLSFLRRVRAVRHSAK